MRTNHLLYIISLVILTASIFFVVEYQNSQRLQLIAGLLIIIGVAMNITAFAMKKR
jgi:uncharacterized membrane protein